MSKSQSHMNFAVNGNAIVCNIINGEIKGRLACRDDERKRTLYNELGIINSSPTIVRFMGKHPNVFGNKKLIQSNGTNFFGEIVQLSPLSEAESYKDMIKSRMLYEFDISEEELEGMEDFIDELYDLHNDSEFQTIVGETEKYKDSIERVWKSNETQIMKYVRSVLGRYEPKAIGKVSTYIMYPNLDTHRSCQVANDKTFLFFGKCGEKDPNKILSYLAHQAIHQPMLPYTPSMTKKEKEEFHAFIKFLTDKEVYASLTGKSYLDIVTENENPEVMGKIYPFWLGYRYRNADREGKNPVELINKAIKRDKDYFDSLPIKSRKRKLFATYNFEKIDAEKLASFFKSRRGITPYEFAKLDFNDKSLVYYDRYIKKSQDVDFYDV